MGRLTKKQLEKQAWELLALRPSVERYEQLQRELKQGMHQLGVEEIESDQGRVFISVAERTSFDPIVTRAALGDDLADKVTKIKMSVCNKLIAALFEVGDISSAEMATLMDVADKREVIALHIRPLG